MAQAYRPPVTASGSGAPGSSNSSSSASSSSGGSSKALLIGVGAGIAAIAGVLYVLTRPVSRETPGKGSSGSGAQSGPSSAAAPPLSKDTMLRIFQRMQIMMQNVVMSLAEQEQQVRAAQEQRGAAQISNEELEQYLMGRFCKALSEVEATVYREHNTDEETVRAATAYFESDPDVQKALGGLKRLFKAVTGQQPTGQAEVPPGITKEKVLAVMKETMESMNDLLEGIHASLLNKGLNPDSMPFKQQLQAQYMEQMPPLRERIQKEHGMTEDVLHSAVLSFQQDPGFQQHLMTISNAHRARLEKIGLGQQ